MTHFLDSSAVFTHTSDVPSPGRGLNAPGNGNSPAAGRVIGTSYDEPLAWDRIGFFAAGVTVGIAIGAGAALLLAPRSGEDTRTLIRSRAQDLADRVADRRDRIRDDILWRSRQGRKALSRGLIRGRWSAEDALEQQRRRLRV